jgi:vancomycin permeability regulator SanA
MSIAESGYCPDSKIKKFFCHFLLFLGIIIVAAILIFLRVQTKYLSRIESENNLPVADAILVFGAGLKTPTTPSAILEDRVEMAVNLYRAGKASTVIMSGDNTTSTHDEVGAMKKFAVKEGLPESAIVLEPAGASTRASCALAAKNFPAKKIILVTQRYHLGRALFLCNESGLDAFGATSDLRPYLKIKYYVFREFFASLAAWVGVGGK